MRIKTATRSFYLEKLGFAEFGREDFPGYLMLVKDRVHLHFFEFSDLDPLTNYGQVYIRTNDIYSLNRELVERGANPPPPVSKPWGQVEFSLLDPDHNLLTFGEAL